MTSADCPHAASLPALLDEHGADEPDGLLAHLEACADCQRCLEELAAEPSVWHDTAAGLTDATRHEHALLDVVLRLRSAGATEAAAQDLSFLRPAGRPEVLGLLGSYEVQQVVGRGGMGIVLKAFDPGLNRLAAIKVMAPFLAASATARRRFVREGRAAAAVAHEHVVNVYSVDEAEGLPCLVMQWIEGETLQERLDRQGPLPVEEIVRLSREIAAGLAAAHAQGLIHRDIKPANILLEQGARVKITDFGLARMVDDAGVTQDGVVAGTPEYMAPEQARGEAVDHRADLFSVGSVMYAMAAGRPPFSGAAPLAVLRQVCEETPSPLQSLNPSIPAWLETLVARLQAKVPAERIQSAPELVALLAAYAAHREAPDRIPAPELAPLPVPARSPRRRLAAALAAMCALTLIVTVTLLQLVPGAARPLLAEYVYDFREARPVPAEMRAAGPDASAALTQEQEGLRITLTDKHAPTPVGVALPLRAHGNFEITIAYDLLRADQPVGQGGVGLELYVVTDTHHGDAVAFYRTQRAHDGDGYYCNRITTVDGLGRRYIGKHFPGTCKSGQLRLARSGSEVTFAAAEGDEFRELYRCDLGPEDVKSIYVRAFPGKPANAVDLRIKDIRLRAESFAERPRDVAASAAEPAAVQTRWKVWLMLGITLALVAGAALAAWRQRQRKDGLG